MIIHFIIIIIIIIIIIVIISSISIIIIISNVLVVVVNLQQPVLSDLATWSAGQAQTSVPVAGQAAATTKHSVVELAVQFPPISNSV